MSTFCGVLVGWAGLEQRGGLYGNDTQPSGGWLPKPCEPTGPTSASGSHQGSKIHRPWPGWCSLSVCQQLCQLPDVSCVSIEVIVLNWQADLQCDLKTPGLASAQVHSLLVLHE